MRADRSADRGWWWPAKTEKEQKGRGEEEGWAVSDPQKEGEGKNRMEAEKDEVAVEDRQGCTTDPSINRERSMNGASNEDGDKVKVRRIGMGREIVEGSTRRKKETILTILRNECEWVTLSLDFLSN